MINTFFSKKIKEIFKYTPTQQQNEVIDALSDFLSDRRNDTAFLLRGYAGTGKTSLIGALVQSMLKLKQKVVLLAPTGRAAKVFSSYAEYPAYTIHKRIYRQKRYGEENSNYSLNDNLHHDTLFIVDEASMIANQGLSGVTFGSGRLLDDLIQYVYSGTRCKLIIMGDTAQLPPVGEQMSPALIGDRLAGYGLAITEYEMTEVVRQEEDSGILYNATSLRSEIAEGVLNKFPMIQVKGFSDVIATPGMELIEEINMAYGRDGIDETIIVCRSNKTANLYNKGIRASVLYREDELNTGDLLMVNRNNYYWSKDYKEMDFIANGEVVQVERIQSVYELYGFRFADVTIVFPDHDHFEMEVKLLLDSLHTDTAALPRSELEKLFRAVLEDYADIPLRKDRMNKMKADAHFNALQIKYAYAITAHKAQGGQWKNVFLDQGYMTEEYVNLDYFRWLYTAITRATDKLYLVNFPKTQLITK